MKAIITLSAFLFALSTQAMMMCETEEQKRTGAPCYTCDTFYNNHRVCSVYPMGTIAGNTDQYCLQTTDILEHGYPEYKCSMMREVTEAGYTLKQFPHDHGLITSLYFYGNQLDLGLSKHMAIGKVKDYQLPDGFEVAWADWGTANSVYEYRYSLQGRAQKRTPHALIYRRNFVSSAASDYDFSAPWKRQSVTSSLFVIKLLGVSTKLVAIVDSIAADQDGKNAGKIARECADSLAFEPTETHNKCSGDYFIDLEE